MPPALINAKPVYQGRLTAKEKASPDGPIFDSEGAFALRAFPQSKISLLGGILGGLGVLAVQKASTDQRIVEQDKSICRVAP